MPELHFLNVKQGDCSVIKHISGNVTVIDVCNAKEPDPLSEGLDRLSAAAEEGLQGNFRQKDYPVNPISYLTKHGITSVFRFVATHPDMDHLDGLKVLFKTFSPTNFWDTENTCVKDSFDGSPFDKADWTFYKSLRDGTVNHGAKRLTLHSGATGKYFNRTGEGNAGGDGLSILAPTEELVRSANECEDYNDCSYVLHYKTGGFNVVFGGDSHDATWEHILTNHPGLNNVDLLIAPHHGRDSDRDYKFLDVLRPKMTFFGNANSQHLAYDKWNSRKLPFITNNQAGCMIAIFDDKHIHLYVTHEAFARSRNRETFYAEAYDAYYLTSIRGNS